MRRRLALLAIVAAPFAGAAPAVAVESVPGEVAVVAADGTTHAERVRGDVDAAARRIARRPGIRAAAPNAVARVAWIPDDPGQPSGRPGGWQNLQWNFLATPAGVDAPAAWDVMRALGKPGGKGVVVAVLDTGVAYRGYRSYRKSPDFSPALRRGYDFVEDNRFPIDRNGHGTHVASTIAESVDNGIGLTGLAYGATILPVRVLDRYGEGDSVAIARGIRFAADRGADIINLSFEFTPDATAASIPGIIAALRYARRKGVLIVAASGNEGVGKPSYPARAAGVVAVGATTEHACLARYSNRGADLDVVAPGGGADARFADDAACRPQEPAGRDILQMTLTGSSGTRFGLPTGYEGTSMATPHVSATAALVMASGVLGSDPAPKDVERRLEETATDLGVPGFDTRYGWGKVDAFDALTAPLGAGAG